jgi:hypothetical protein
VVNFIYLYDSIFIPISLSYIIRTEFILDKIADCFENCSTLGCGKLSVNISINRRKKNRPTGRLKRRQEDNIKKILKEMFCDVNLIKIPSDKATSNVKGKLNITSSAMLFGSQFKIST